MKVLPQEEFQKRLEKVRNQMKKENIDAYCLFSPLNISYLANFSFAATERPICMLITQNNIKITVPLLENNRAEEHSLISQVYYYYDYPGNKNGEYYHHSSRTPENTIQKMIHDTSFDNIAADMNGAPGIMGYNGPSLEEMIGQKIAIRDWTSEMRLTKSSNEIEIFKQAGKWCDLSFKKLKEEIEPGVNETVLNKRMEQKMTEHLLNEHEDYSSRMELGGLTEFIILSGNNTYNPHGMNKNRNMQNGDIVLAGMYVKLAGYVCELERTFFLGEPSEKQKNYFQIMQEAQQIAIENTAAGVKASHIDQEVHNYLKEQNMLEYTKHHTGHGLGIEEHEPPFIDRGNNKKLQKNQIISLEPGLYIPQVGGFRHSDTFIVKEKGVETVTKTPRKLKPNIL